jgi:hypothetical protein
MVEEETVGDRHGTKKGAKAHCIASQKKSRSGSGNDDLSLQEVEIEPGAPP